jgi:hypothetical protein
MYRVHRDYAYDPAPVHYQPAYLGTLVGDVATWFFGNATERMKRFLKEHGEEEITAIEIGRIPLMKEIASAMNLITSGKFDESKKNRGYDDYFHLFLVINGKYRLEKNQTVNVMTGYSEKDNEERYVVSGKPKGKTINDFLKNTEEEMGENDFWQNYDGLVKNCQNWVMQNLKANNVYTQAIEDFTFQDTQELQLEVSPYVKGAMKEVTNLASGLDKFLSWISGGSWGFKRGGKVGMPSQQRKMFL